MKLIAKGNTAEIYEYGDNLICKLFFEQYPKEYIEHEFNNAALACKLGIRTPKAHKLITEGDQHGIVYDRIIGEELSGKIYAQSEDASDYWLNEFVGFHKKLLQYKTDEAISYKDFLKMFATDEKTIAKIDALADGNYFIHGDYHPQNVMIDDDNKVVLIDMMNVCRGPKLYEVARTYFLLDHNELIQRKYLEKMGYSIKDIEPYLDVIMAIRENETEGNEV